MKGKPIKIIVCQHGARHRYAIPRMFEKLGILEAFYTDSHARSTIGSIVSKLGSYAPSSFQRLSGRLITGVSKEKIYATDKMHVIEFLQSILRKKPTGIKLFLQRHQVLSKQMKRWGLKNSNYIYSMNNENIDFIRWAKENDTLCIVDVFISPTADIVVASEFERFPDWGDDQIDSNVALNIQRWKETSELADILICPSEWVAEGVCQITPEVSDKIRIVPYGCSIDYQGRFNNPIKGRVLFAGGDALRKGLHYLAKATTLLKQRLPELEVRIAGALPLEVIQHPICKDLNFLGKLSSEQMKTEYLSADVFVLPSLAEGFAGVVAEAIGGGCPVIVTKEAGAPIVHEREGLIIPSKDSNILAEAMERMITDREFRKGCSDACLKQVPFYSEQEWGYRLRKSIEK